MTYCLNWRRNGLEITLHEVISVVDMVDVRPDIGEACFSKDFSTMDNAPLVDYFDIDAFLDDCKCPVLRITLDKLLFP